MESLLLRLLVDKISWRNGSASDSRSEGCVFKSRRGHLLFKPTVVTVLAPRVEKRDTVMVETSPFPQPQKVKEVVFSPLCVCLSVCVKDISKSLGRIRMKLCGQVRNITRTNWFDFGEDPEPECDFFFSVILHH